jgi:hypothetical protein
MIPPEITRDHIIRAIADIKSGGVPKKREPTKFNLVYEGRLKATWWALPFAFGM